MLSVKYNTDLKNTYTHHHYFIYRPDFRNPVSSYLPKRSETERRSRRRYCFRSWVHRQASAGSSRALSQRKASRLWRRCIPRAAIRYYRACAEPSLFFSRSDMPHTAYIYTYTDGTSYLREQRRKKERERVCQRVTCSLVISSPAWCLFLFPVARARAFFFSLSLDLERALKWSAI